MPVAGTRSLHDVLRARTSIGETQPDLMIIPDAGHAVYLEAPDAVIGAATRFLGGAS